MGTPFRTRVVLKIKKVVRELAESPEERDFRRNWSMVDSIEGWLLFSEGMWLFNAARSLPNRANLLEIGSYKGRSTCCLALGCRGSQKRVFAVDPFDGGPDLPTANSLPDFSQNIKRCRVSDSVEPFVGLSSEVAKTWDKRINLLFIDGSHSYEDVLADFTNFFPHVVPGGIVVLHDVIETWPGVFKAWHEVIKHRLSGVGYRDALGYGRKRMNDDRPSPRPHSARELSPSE
jgi:predicted O-methyltransferase YrrM